MDNNRKEDATGDPNTPKNSTPTSTTPEESTSIEPNPNEIIPTMTTPIEDTQNETIPIMTTPIEETQNDTIPITATPTEETQNDTIPIMTTPIEVTQNDTIPIMTTPTEETQNETIPIMTTPIEETQNDTIPIMTTPTEKTQNGTIPIKITSIEQTPNEIIPIMTTPTEQTPKEIIPILTTRTGQTPLKPIIIEHPQISPIIIEPNSPAATSSSIATPLSAPEPTDTPIPSTPTPTTPQSPSKPLSITPLTPIIIEPTERVTSFVPRRHFRASNPPTPGSPVDSTPTSPILTPASPTSATVSDPNTPRRSIDDLPTFIAKRRAEQPKHRLSRFIMKGNYEDAKNYDFASARPAMMTTNVVDSIGHLIKSCLGGGVVTVHEAYRSCGIWTALGLSLLLGICCSYCMYILASSAQKLYGRVCVPCMSYPDVMEACVEVGPWRCIRKYHSCFRFLMDFTIGINLFGACCIYQIVMARSLKQLVEGSDVVLDDGKPMLGSYIIILMFPCLLICMITTMKYFAPFTVVADLFIVCLALVMIYYGCTMSTTSPLNMPAFNNVEGLFQFLGIWLFSVSGVSATMVIENHMAEPKRFPVVLLGGMSVVVATTITMGFFGYWGYGDTVQSPITLNLPWSPFPLMLKISLVLLIYLTYALNFWIPFELIWHYIKMHHAPAQYWFWERIYRAAFVIVLTLIAYMLPNVTYFTALIGTACITQIGFVFPAFIQLSLDWVDPGPGFLLWRVWRFAFILLMGLSICFGGIYFNMKGLISEVFYKKQQ